jgi:hypothetical protein
MDIRLYCRIILYFLGTCIVLFVLIVLGMNFFSDARLFAKPASKAAVSNTTVDMNVNKTTTEQGPEPEKPHTAAAPTEKPLKQEDRIKVEVVNYSGIAGLAEKVRAKLEAAGFDASSGNGRSTEPGRSEILERNEKKAGGKVQKLLGAIRVRKEIAAESRFDVTLIIGDDYKQD